MYLTLENICFYFMQTHVLFILSLLLLRFNITTTTSLGPKLVVAAGEATNTCIDNERQALLAFKARLLDPDDLLPTWRPEEQDDCCKWSEVTCDNQTGHVTKLELCYYDTASVAGEISLSLLNLTYLNHLDLSFCSFHGTIPPFIGSMTHLTYLDLSDNEFIGTIPMFIGNMTQLKFLALSYNRFTGTFPMSIGSLTGLAILSLEGNQFVGTIPMSIGYLTNLTDLSLSENNFSGIIPRSIGSLTKLKTLYLSENSFHGTIPPEFGNLTNLESLLLNHLTSCTVENLDWLSSLSSLSELNMEGTSLAKADNWVNVVIGLQNLECSKLSRCGPLAKFIAIHIFKLSTFFILITLSWIKRSQTHHVTAGSVTLVGNRLMEFFIL
ncbi:leucine-rich repeat-containing protein [Tanacetum coccineum]